MAENGDQSGDGYVDEGLGVGEDDQEDQDPTSETGDGDAGSTGVPDPEAGDADTEDVEDPELEAIKARVREMEEEAEKLKNMQSEVDKQLNLSANSVTSPARLSQEEKIDADNRSIYVGNVDYGATAEELEAHFHGCGSVNRVTILCDKFSGHPKGFAYIEFADKDSVATATALDESLFRGRQIKVSAKRTNRPGISSTDRGAPRGRGRGRGRGAAYGGGYGGFAPRARGGRFRARRVVYYTPY